MLMLVGQVMVSVYFGRRRSLAFGLSESGVALGGLLAGPLFRIVVDAYAMKGTLIILAAFYVQGIGMAALYRPLGPKTQKLDHVVQPNKRDSNTDKQETLRDSRHVCGGVKRYLKGALDLSLLYKDAGGMLLYAGTFLGLFGIFTFIIHSVGRAISVGLHPEQAALMTTCMSVASFGGRFISTAISQNCDNKRLQYSLWFAGSAISGMCFILTYSFLTMSAVAVLHGMFNGEYSCIVILAPMLLLVIAISTVTSTNGYVGSEFHR